MEDAERKRLEAELARHAWDYGLAWSAVDESGKRDEMAAMLAILAEIAGIELPEPEED